MPLEQLPALLIAILAVGYTPGPANIYAMSCSLRYGCRASMRMWCGLLCGFLTAALLAAAAAHLAGMAFTEYVPFTPIEESTLTYNGGFAMWRKSYFDNIKAISAELTPANVMKWNGPIGQLKKAIINPLGVDALFVTEFYDGAGTAERSADLTDIIARLKKGDKLYIGAILGYHN